VIRSVQIAATDGSEDVLCIREGAWRMPGSRGLELPRGFLLGLPLVLPSEWVARQSRVRYLSHDKSSRFLWETIDIMDLCLHVTLVVCRISGVVGVGH
jgi:hypothetical protein